MKVRNKAPRLYILGDHSTSRQGTRLMPGAVTDVGDDKITILCVKRAIEKGKPLEIVEGAPKPKKKAAKQEDKAPTFGGAFNKAE